jgi:hypothetical protein
MYSWSRLCSGNAEKVCNELGLCNIQSNPNKGAVIIYGGGWAGCHRREMFFVRTILLTQPLKSQKFDYPISNINFIFFGINFIKTKGYHSVVTHVLYHFCYMSLITACEIICSLKFHIVCTCSFFGDTICLLTCTNQKMIKIVTLIDSHILYLHMTVDIAF